MPAGKKSNGGAVPSASYSKGELMLKQADYAQSGTRIDMTAVPNSLLYPYAAFTKMPGDLDYEQGDLTVEDVLEKATYENR